MRKSLYRGFGQDVGKVNDMNYMFYGAHTFNQNISGWKVDNVVFMGAMFNGAVAFNQNISGWNVEKVTNYSGFRTGSALNDDNTPKKFKDGGE